MAKIFQTKFAIIGRRRCCFVLVMGIFVIVSIVRFQREKGALESSSSFVMETMAERRPTKVKPHIVIPQPVRDEDKVAILDYHRMEETLCRQRIGNGTTKVNWCPCVPGGLQGRVTINMADDETWSEIAEKVGGDVSSGGEWKPEGCVAYSRVAVVIPCRDRESHLRVLLRHLVPILKRQMVHFRIFVADQRFPMIFNKAATMDIGFLEAAKRFPFDCVIFHDVDLLLEDDRALLRCGPHPRHYARALDKFDYSLYPTFGGVVSLTADMFRRVNGYSLRYFGWGGEDDDMWGRVAKLSDIHGMPAVVSRYSTIFHMEDATNMRNPKRHALMDEGSRRRENNTDTDGISDVVYDINDVQLKPLFTRFEADINTTALGFRLEHKVYQYQKVSGFCQDPDVAAITSGISWASCRFLCDSTVGQTCFGFSYATRKCAIMRTVCNLSPMTGWTYVKEEEFRSLRPST